MQMVQGRPNQALIETIQLGSPYLKKLHKSFQAAFHQSDSMIVAFYETGEMKTAQEAVPGKWTPTGPYRTLVEKASATNCHPFEHKALPIARNHQDMVKFSDGQDLDYQIVLDYLIDFQ